jgi:hypothetical protein
MLTVDATRQARIALLVCMPYVATAQTSPVPVRGLRPAGVASNSQLRSVAALRALPGGRLIVNDVVAGRLVLLDSMLRLENTLAAVAKTRTGYRPARGGLIPYLADSTLFLDVARLTLLVIDPAGRVSRTIASPRSSDLGSLTSAPAGNPGVDRRGHLIYRLGGPSRAERIRKGHATGGQRPDTAAIIRFDLTARRFDTVAFVRIHSPRILPLPDTVRGGTWFSPVLDPLPVVDDWAVLPDGTVAIVRGEDYHVDYIDAANRKVSGKKLPFARVRMTYADKSAVIDSSRALRARLVAQGIGISVNTAPTALSAMPDDDAIIITDDSAISAAGQRRLPPVVYAKADDLSDVQPVFASGGVRVDADGNLWVRTIPRSPLAADVTYDVIGRGGSLIDRVKIPRNSVVAGFGPGGAIYLCSRSADGTLTLTRTRK